MMTSMSVRTDTVLRKSNAPLGLAAPPLLQADRVSGLVGWYDAAMNVTSPTGNLVSSWGNRATGMSAATDSGVSTRRPTYVSDANGARIAFDGTTLYQQLAATFDVPTIERTHYVVFAKDTDRINGTLIEVSDQPTGTTSNRESLIIYETADRLTHRTLTSGTLQENDIYFTSDLSQERIAFLGKSATQMRPTGGVSANYLSGGTSTRDGRRLSIGGLFATTNAWTHKGYIKEILIYNRFLNNTEHQQVINYLTAKYRLWTVQGITNVGLLGRPALALDLFDGALGTSLQNGTVRTDGGIWLDTNAVWEKDGAGAARCSLNSGDPTNNNILYVGAGQANVIVSARIDATNTTDDPGFGLCFNAQERNQNWRALLQNGGTTARISVRSSATNGYREYNIGALFSSYTPQDIFSVLVNGDSVVLLKNGRVNSNTLTIPDRPLKNIPQHGLASNFDAVANRGVNVSEAFEFSVETI